MLKRLLATTALTVALMLAPVGVLQPPAQADECFMFTFCWVYPDDSGCIDILICIIGGG